MELAVDSRSLQMLLSLINKPEERYNKVDLAAIGESFDDVVLYAIHLCPGKELLADALTKDNAITATERLQAFSNRKQKRPAETHMTYDLPSS